MTVGAMLLGVAAPASAFASANGSGAASGDASAATIVSEAPSITTLPDGITWGDVREYIDGHFTGSKVFADAVYQAIRDSGQDFTDPRLVADGKLVESAADVISVFGIHSPEHTTITISKPLEDGAVLTGVTLLNQVGHLRIEDVGNHKGFAFIEDAFDPKIDGVSSDRHPGGPAIDIGPIDLTVLPKNPYTYNLTKARSGQHSFNTHAYSDLTVDVVRDLGGEDMTVEIDTTLTGRGMSVDLGSVVGDGGEAAGADGSEEAAKVIRPTGITTYFNERFGEKWQDTNRITAKGNVITMSIPSCGVDGDYEKGVKFDYLYQQFGGLVEQLQSIDHFYRTNVFYLNTVQVTGQPLVLGDIKARKVDAASGEPLPFAHFALYTDKAGKHVAQQAVVGLGGEVQRDESGEIMMQDVEVESTGVDGIVHFEYLKPGDYYLKELAPPTGYGLVEPIKVTVKGAETESGESPAGLAIGGGQGSEIETLKKRNTARADDFKSASNWLGAIDNITMTSDYATSRVDDGVYIMNAGKPITLAEPDLGQSGLTPLGAGGYTVAFGSGKSGGEESAESPESQRFATLAEAQDAINAMIKGRQLTCANAAITIDAGGNVYHREATDADLITVADKPLPVHLRAAAGKILTGGEKLESDRFRFTIDGADGRGAVHETVGVKAAADDWSFISYDGIADFSPLTFSEPGEYEFTITEEIDRSDTSVAYNPEGVSYKIWIDVKEDWLGRFTIDGEEANPSDDGESGDGTADDDLTGDESSGGDRSPGDGSVDGQPSGGQESSDATAPDAADPDPDSYTHWHRGLVAMMYSAKVTTGKDGKPVVGEREFLGKVTGQDTNVEIKDEEGRTTGFTPNPRLIGSAADFTFTNVAKDTALPRTGSSGLLVVSAAGLLLLLAGALVVTRESRRH